MFFRYLDATHPANRGKDVERYKHAIRDMYVRADELVGRVMAATRPARAVAGHFRSRLSEHSAAASTSTPGCMQQGLLHLKDGAATQRRLVRERRLESHAGVRVRSRGPVHQPEGPRSAGHRRAGRGDRALKRRLIAELAGLRDRRDRRDRDQRALRQRCRCTPAGPYRNNGPDLIVGYNRGYRASWEGAVGPRDRAVITDNTKSWSGDHCVDPRLVPGVLFSNWRIATPTPAIADLAPTILQLFGVDVPEHMTGRALDSRTTGQGGMSSGRSSLRSRCMRSLLACVAAAAPLARRGCEDDHPRRRRHGPAAAAPIHQRRARRRISAKLAAQGGFVALGHEHAAAEPGRLVELHHRAWIPARTASSISCTWIGRSLTPYSSTARVPACGAQAARARPMAHSVGRRADAAASRRARVLGAARSAAACRRRLFQIPPTIRRSLRASQCRAWAHRT